jgi:23S rRNA (pseudouridine1915-N3)-methyltransferase
VKLIILSVGHKMPDWITAGFNEYAKRMPREAQIVLQEIKPEPRTTGKTTAQIMEAEARRILAALPQNCRRIALDEHGAQQTTGQMAAQMQEWMREGGDVAFIIGGADGLHASVKQAAQQLLALSAMTLPHAHVRVLLAEQLYRAYSMLHNHPCCRDYTTTHLPCIAEPAPPGIAQADRRQLRNAAAAFRPAPQS